MGFFDFLTEEIAIDLGTANTLIIHKDKVVVDSPSIVAIDRTTNKVIAIGHEASMMQGKTHENIKTIRPLKDGVIADFNASEQMISMLIKSVPTLKKKVVTPALKMVICIPSGITEVEMRAVRESAERVNGKEVYLIHEPMAAAIGIGIDIKQPKGNMIVDIGGGTTEIAVIALSGIVCEKSVKIAGDVFTNDIVYYMRRQHNLYVGERTAEKIKINVGSATEDLDNPPEDMCVQGRDLLSGKPKQVVVSHREVGKQTQSFAAALKAALREDPDVILVGEMRDLETISLALTAAETGHLVFGTLHTSGAPSTINRIIDVFPPEQQEQIRAQISTSLKMVVTQRLLKTKDGQGRCAAFEIMKCTPPVQNLIREAKIHQIPSVMQTSVKDGMITMDKSMEALVQSGKINPGDAKSEH